MTVSFRRSWSRLNSTISNRHCRRIKWCSTPSATPIWRARAGRRAIHAWLSRRRRVINRPSAVLATGRADHARLAQPARCDCALNRHATSRASLLSRSRRHRRAPRLSISAAGANARFPHRPPFCTRGTSGSAGRRGGQLPGKELTVIEFLNARGADGKVRKYRVMMIDGQLYPLHVAISSQWKIHYFTAEMAERADHRAEDAEFLENMPGVLGPRAHGCPRRYPSHARPGLCRHRFRFECRQAICCCSKPMPRWW